MKETIKFTVETEVNGKYVNMRILCDKCVVNTIQWQGKATGESEDMKKFALLNFFTLRRKDYQQSLYALTEYADALSATMHGCAGYWLDNDADMLLRDSFTNFLKSICTIAVYNAKYKGVYSMQHACTSTPQSKVWDAYKRLAA